MSKQYEEYKDSGIAWLGEIPAHWSISPLKRFADLKNGYAFNSDDLDYDAEVPVVRIGDIKEPMDIEGAKKVGREIADQRQDFRVHYNDILIAMTGATIGKSCIYKSEVEALLNQRVGAFRAMEGTSVGFLKYLIESPLFREYITVECYGGAQENISKDQLLNFKFPVPNSEAEAESIAVYLDYKIGQIDKLIAQKEELMNLLQKKRQAIINEAVTQGLDPDAPRRDSGIEWLGEIPAHWEVWKVARAFNTIGSGTTPQSGEDVYYENGVINWVNTGDLNDGLLTDCEKKITQRAFDDHSALKIYPAGTILIAMYGATIGKTSLLGIDACTNQACCALTDSLVIDNKYAFYWFLAHKELIVSMGYGGGQPNISQNTIRNLRICRPPEGEQAEIVKYLEEATFKINEALDNIETQVQKLKSYRQSIINEVVTGKVDVREVALNEV